MNAPIHTSFLTWLNSQNQWGKSLKSDWFINFFNQQLFLLKLNFDCVTAWTGAWARDEPEVLYWLTDFLLCHSLPLICLKPKYKQSTQACAEVVAPVWKYGQMVLISKHIALTEYCSKPLGILLGEKAFTRNVLCVHLFINIHVSGSCISLGRCGSAPSC